MRRLWLATAQATGLLRRGVRSSRSAVVQGDAHHVRSTCSASPSPCTIPTGRGRIPIAIRGLLALTYDPETGEENCIGCRLCEFVCPPAVIKVEMLKGGEAQLREDLHARAVRVRVLRAVRAGLPDRRDHHDEVVRHGDRRSPRDAARQGPAARDRLAATSRRGPPATGCATCRRRRRKKARPRGRPKLPSRTAERA